MAISIITTRLLARHVDDASLKRHSPLVLPFCQYAERIPDAGFLPDTPNGEYIIR